MTSFIKLVVVVPPQLSVEVARARGSGNGTRFAHWTVIFAGHVMDGAVLSNTVMVCVHDAELPHSSVAWYVRVILNRFMHVWLDMTSPTCVTVVVPPQLSVEVTLSGFGVGTRFAHWTVTFTGHVIDGAVLSNMVIVCVHVAELPHWSVAW
jgi:hypothetical protein